jgi:hypothetical protein
VGERSCIPQSSTSVVISGSNASYAQQLAWQRHSPGIRSSASLASLAGISVNPNNYPVASASTAGQSTAAQNAAAGGSAQSRMSLGLSARGASLSPSPGGGSGSSSASSKNINNSVQQGTPPKAASGFMVRLH